MNIPIRYWKESDDGRRRIQGTRRPTRRRILELLRAGDMTAGELAEHFDISKPSLSHHLATLRNAGLVTDERHGQNIVYSLNTTVMQDLVGWFMGFADDPEDRQ